MDPKRILISINTSWNVYNFRKGLIKFLHGKGYGIIVLAPNDDYSSKLTELGVEYHCINMDKKGSNPFNDYLLLKNYKKKLKELNPDICLFYTIKPNIYGSLACNSLGIPYINNISGLGTVFIRNTLSSKIAKRLYKIALRKSPYVFFQNEDDLNIFNSKSLISHNRTKVIPGSGVDLNHFRPMNMPEKKGKFIFLMMSRLIFDKGIREYIQASKKMLSQYDNIEIHVLGNAEEEAKLGYSESDFQNLIKGNHITWFPKSEDVRPYLAEADVFVLPSYREGLSKALLEACAMEKPILTSDTPGCRDLVNNGKNGLLCKVADSEDLYDKMKKLYDSNHSELIQMGKESRKIVENKYGEEFIFEAYLNAITEILG